MRFTKPTVDGNAEEVSGYYDEIKDFRMDTNGYFLIKIDKENKKIVVGFCKKDNKILVKITGNKPQDIYHEVFKRDLAKRMEHAAYLGKECQKAYIALQLGLDYVQDEELNFKK